MGESSPTPKRRYTKPSMKATKQASKLPKLSPGMFNISQDKDRAPSTGESSSNPWTSGGIRLFPIGFDSWPNDALSDDFAFSSVYQNLNIHRIDRPKFTKSLANLSGLRLELERNFILTFGWRPPAELLLWMESEAAKNNALCPPVHSTKWDLFLQLCSTDTETIQKRSFFSWTKGESIMADPLGLFTGLFLFGQSRYGEKLLVSSLPSTGNAAVFHTDNNISYLGRTRADSIMEFLLSEASRSEQYALDAQVTKRLLKNVPKNPATETVLASQLLFARTRWLVALLSRGELPESFENMLLDAPDWNLWQEEKQWLGQFPFLANYWHMAHWFFGNEGACREAISLARKATGSVTARLADIVGRLLDGARLDLAALRADRIDGIRKKIQASLTPDMLGPLAKAAMERKSFLLPKTREEEQPAEIQRVHILPESQILKRLKSEIKRAKRLHDLLPSAAVQINLSSPTSEDIKNLLDESTVEDAERIIQAVIDLGNDPLDLGACWGHVMKSAGNLGLTSFAPLAMRYCKTLVEDQRWDCNTDDTRCYCVAESARAAAMLIPDKANPYLLNLLHDTKEKYPPRFIGIGALLLAGLLVIDPHDKKNISLLKLALHNRALPRSAYLYGALRAIQTTCESGKSVDISPAEITIHIPDKLQRPKTPLKICDATQLAIATLLGRTNTIQFSKPKENASIKELSSWIKEQIGHSRFLLHPLNQPHNWDGLMKLAMHGKASSNDLWKFIDLEHMHKDWIGPIITLCRRVTPISSMFEKFQNPAPESIKKLLYSPTHESIGWMDFIAAWVSLDPSPTSLAAVSSVCNWRFNNRPTETEFEEMLHLRLPLVLASFGKRSLVHFEKLLKKSTDDFNRTILKEALQRVDEWESGEKPPVCNEEQMLSGITLEYISQFESFSSHFELSSSDGRNPSIRISLKENHELLNDGIYPAEYSHNITFQSMDELRSFSNKFARVATILGYTCKE